MFHKYFKPIARKRFKTRLPREKAAIVVARLSPKDWSCSCSALFNYCGHAIST